MREFLKKNRWFVLVAAILLVAYTGVNTWTPTYGTNQIIAHGDLVALQAGGNVAWKTNPGWANTDGQGATINEVNTYVNGCSIAAGSYGTAQLATFAQVHACAVVTSYTKQTGTIGTGYYQSNFQIASFNQLQGTYSCQLQSGGTSGTPYSTSSTAQPPSASTPMTISVSNMTLANGGSTSWTVSLTNPAGTVVWSQSGSGSSLTATVSSVSSGGVGTWKWSMTASGSTTTCDRANGTDGSPDRVDWNGTNFTYYQ